jgi:hypothetical protein
MEAAHCLLAAKRAMVPVLRCATTAVAEAGGCDPRSLRASLDEAQALVDRASALVLAQMKKAWVR